MKKLVLAAVVVAAIAVFVLFSGQGEEGTEAPGTSPGSEVDAAAPATGTVRGEVVYTGASWAPEPVDMSADPNCVDANTEPVYEEVLVLGEGKTLANVFVQVLNPPAGGAEVPGDPVHITFQGCMYTPRVVGVRVGQDLVFRNGDETLHNIHALPEVNTEFNQGQPFQGMELVRTFTEPEGPFEVKSDVHPWERAYIAVVAHPYFAVTDESGRFEIPGLPDGTYEVEAWHERLGTQRQTVTVSGGTTTADFTFQDS